MIWLNGNLVDGGSIATTDRGFLLGDGLFETILLIDSVPVFLTAHLDRLRRGLAVVKIDVSIDEADVAAAIASLCIAENCRDGRGVARLTVSAGPGKRGLRRPIESEATPTVLLSVSRANTSNNDIINVIVSTYRRSETSLGASHKTLNYLDNIMAANEAFGAGFDDAVMVNSHGDVAGAAIANIFILAANSALLTPAIETGALPGITREYVIDAAANIGIEVIEGTVEVSQIEQNPFFLTNSIAGLRRASLQPEAATGVWDIDHQMIFDSLRNAYDAMVRNDLLERKKA